MLYDNLSFCPIRFEGHHNIQKHKMGKNKMKTNRKKNIKIKYPFYHVANMITVIVTIIVGVGMLI